MVEHPLHEPSGQHDVIERTDRSVEPEMNAGDRRGSQEVEVFKLGNAACRNLGQEPPDAIERDRKRPRSRPEAIRRSAGLRPGVRLPRSRSIERTPVVERTVHIVVAQPFLQTRSVEVAERNQGQFHLETGPRAQEAVDEDLACMADVHLLEPLVEGGDQDGRPEQIDRPRALVMPAQPLGERFARPFVPRESQAGKAVANAKPVPQGEVVRLEKAPRQMKRGGRVRSRSREIRPSRLRKTTSGSRRNRTSIPTRRQKSARFVQQAMLTC